ncbi:hypothetical protein ACWELP_25505 [Rhodococcus aetherivorans]
MYVNSTLVSVPADGKWHAVVAPGRGFTYIPDQNDLTVAKFRQVNMSDSSGGQSVPNVRFVKVGSYSGTTVMDDTPYNVEILGYTPDAKVVMATPAYAIPFLYGMDQYGQWRDLPRLVGSRQENEPPQQ